MKHQTQPLKVEESSSQRMVRVARTDVLIPLTPAILEEFKKKCHRLGKTKRQANRHV